MKILIAEDDFVSQLVLSSGLKKLGHVVTVAQNGEEAWKAYVEGRHQIVITDWMMPVMDGLQLCRKIRAHDRAKYTYIIMLTTLSGKTSFLEGMHAGADDFLNKPFDLQELSARLRVTQRILSLQTEVVQLEGLLPICAYCKKIRDEENVWHPIESYVGCRTHARFSHGYCPSCYEREVEPQLVQLRIKRQQKQNAENTGNDPRSPV